MDIPHGPRHAGGVLGRWRQAVVATGIHYSGLLFVQTNLIPHRSPICPQNNRQFHFGKALEVRSRGLLVVEVRFERGDC